MRSNVSISGIRLERHCHEMLSTSDISPMCAPSPTPPDGPPVSAGSEGSLSAPLSETRSGFQILKCVVRITSPARTKPERRSPHQNIPPIIF